MIYFYDTCALLDKLDSTFEDPNEFYISNLTLKELENIKISSNKDEEIKYKARKLIHLIEEHWQQIKIINYNKDWDLYISDPLSDNIDSRIIITAIYGVSEKITFVTSDLCCKQLARSLNLNVEYLDYTKADKYKGYKEITLDDVELAKFYSNLYPTETFNLLPNEYLLIKNSNNEIIDHYKYTKDKNLERIVQYPIFDSKMFGKVKPKDDYQYIAMNSLLNNQITVLRGPAGTGKSYLALGYLFKLLEDGDIDKIIIFCNTVATIGSAKLGYYPGSRDTKLLDSQIGNFLSSKLGDKIEVERLVEDNKIVLVPLSDIRGYDTSGHKAGVYITEAQNLNIDLMKLALQRIGEDCICILDGDDETQVDLPLYTGKNNGLRRVSEIFRGEDMYGEVTLVNIYRSRIAQLAEKMK